MKRILSLIAPVACAIVLACACQQTGPAVTAIEIEPENLRFTVGETFQLQAIVSPANAKATVGWSSWDDGIATVSASGLATAVSVGKTSFTATAGGKRDNMSVEVLPEPFPIKFARTQLDTTLANDKALDYKFKFKCYDPFKVELDTSVNRFDGMAPTVELNPGEGYARIWDERRVGSVATCKFRVYDDISEQIITVTVRRP